MTKGEAIAILEVSKHMATSGILYNQAIDMAIEALSAEHKHCWGCKHYEPKYNVCHAPEWALNIIKSLPSAEAEQGVWEHIESPLEDNMFKCSKCGNPLKIPTVDGEPIYKYCLHCGAKMGNAWGERND